MWEYLNLSLRICMVFFSPIMLLLTEFKMYKIPKYRWRSLTIYSIFHLTITITIVLHNYYNALAASTYDSIWNMGTFYKQIQISVLSTDRKSNNFLLIRTLEYFYIRKVNLKCLKNTLGEHKSKGGYNYHIPILFQCVCLFTKWPLCWL